MNDKDYLNQWRYIFGITPSNWLYSVLNLKSLLFAFVFKLRRISIDLSHSYIIF